MTLLFENNVHILSSVLRVGIFGSRVDNASTGGIVVGIDEFGNLKPKAYSTKEGKVYLSHPDSKIIFNGYHIPRYSKIIDLVKAEVHKFSHFRLISSDFAIDNIGEPVFIEFNLKNGQLVFHQFCNGPLLVI